ncbi:MAG: SemiSWEET transporter [Candidatus Sumerlaeia bacterium]|nr:SemiSWEET transporter [Candidatus Sumerlaeia bacterium]
MIDPQWVGACAATLTTSAFLPQAILTWRTFNTEGLSVGMFSMMTTGVFLWLCYGWMIDDWIVIVANSITFVLAASILGIKVWNLSRGRK